ncbi:hypothetical protein [Pleomorphovibrio marinus]|uniref:hypothetical protein n=1 Tax=Pleomorphovibrio marinus TaxID=2164132 RepID=UPI000E0BF0E4|nr:hypothetical protein [Pleomorphovibrio marinus]
MQRISLILALLLALNFHAQSQSNLIALEIDPAPYLLNGYSVSLKYSSKKLPKVSLMGSIFSSDFPDAMMAKSNKEKGWVNMKFRPSYALFADYYLNKDRKGFHFGPSVFFYNKSVTLEPYKREIDHSTIYPNLRIAYIYYPFKNIGLYLNPYLNFGSEINTKGPHSIDGVKFEPAKFHYVAALHIGYSIRL